MVKYFVLLIFAFKEILHQFNFFKIVNFYKSAHKKYSYAQNE